MNELQMCLYHNMKRYMEANNMTMYTIRKKNPFPIGMENIRLFMAACENRENFNLSNKLTSKMLDFLDVPHYIDRFEKLYLLAAKDTPEKRVEFKMTEEEHIELEKAASTEGVTRSEFIRKAVINEIKSKVL